MTDLQLYRVRVTQEWSAEAEALVFANNEEEAEFAVYDEIEFDIYDIDDGNKYSCAWPIPLETLETIGNSKFIDEYFYLPVPGRYGQFKEVSLEEMRDFLTPEVRQAIHIREIEKDNGQIDLPLDY